MGSYKLGAECCNNCVHWDAERDDKHGKENVFSYKNYAKCTSSHSPQYGRNVLAEKVCPYFSHVWGIAKTFSIGAAKSQQQADSTTDVLTCAYTQALLAELENRVEIRNAGKAAAQEVECVEESEPEENFDGDAEDEFRSTMEELGKAQRRASELFDAGLSPKSFMREESVEFMHLLDRARSGNVNAQYELGKAFLDGSHGAWELKSMPIGKVRIPFDWLRKAAEKGHVGALYRLGRSNHDGVAKSFDYLSKAAAKGHVEAKRELKELTEELVGKSRENCEECLRLLSGGVHECDVSAIVKKIQSLSEAHDPTGCWEVNVPLYKIDPQCALRISEQLSKYAINGPAEIQNVIGKMYGDYKGFDNIVEPDAEHAVVWFLRAATAGSLDAMDNMGICYANGDGVEKDFGKSVQWYEKAAIAGYSWAQYHLALKLLNVEGADKNIEGARSWLQKAADQGLEKAKKRLASIDDECAAEENAASALRAGWKLYNNGYYENAVRFLSMAEEAGLTEAKYVLGWCYYLGKGVMEDKEKALDLFKSAAMKWFVSTVSDYKDYDGDYNNYGTSCRLVAEDFENKGAAKNAAKWFRFAARSGSLNAAKSLGHNYLNGSCGFEVDLQKAVYWLQIADWLDTHEDGSIDDYLEEAKKQLGEDCEDLEGLEDWNILIDGASGDAESQYQVGCWMFKGEHSFCDDVCAAMAWWYRAAMQGHVQAQLKIAAKFFTGCDDVEKDEKLAFEWYVKAAEQGNAGAQNWVGRYYEMGWDPVEKDLGQAREWFAKSAAQGVSVAQFNLGKIYYFGKGIERDYAKAAKLFAKAAQGGRTDAKVFLGTCYRRGLGVEKSLDKAFELYSEASKDQREAQFWIGRFHEEGWGGVEKDAVLAFEWYMKSAESGDVDAICSVGWAYQCGNGVVKDFAKAAEWFGKGADKGDGVCANNLARLYEDGKGVGKNLEKALELFEMAVDKKCNRANYHLGRFYENGLGVDVDIEKAKEYYGKAAQGDDKDAKAALERLG